MPHLDRKRFLSECDARAVTLDALTIRAEVCRATLSNALVGKNLFALTMQKTSAALAEYPEIDLVARRRVVRAGR